MTQSITRREFLMRFIPKWATRSNLIAGAVGASFVVAGWLAVSVLLKVGFLNIVKLSLIAIGIWCLVFILGRCVSAIEKFIQKSSILFQSFTTVCIQFALIALYCYVGGYLYNRWEVVEDRDEFIIIGCTFFIICMIREWQDRRAKNMRSKK